MAGQRILIVYGTGHGQTAKIAMRIAGLLTTSGTEVACTDVRALPRGLALGDFDVVVIGSSVEYGRHQRRVERFIAAHVGELNAMPSAFFSVSGAAGGGDAGAQARARGYVDDLLRETGWRPRFAETIGGAMAYTKYNPLLRWITKRASAKVGGPTDTSRDYEFTDWTQVQRFAEAVAAMGARAGTSGEPAAV
jgi:menaquinone-dependent protoporphyrinogen oxidase